MAEKIKNYIRELNAFWLSFVTEGPHDSRLRDEDATYLVDIGNAYAGLVDSAKSFRRSADTRGPWKRGTVPIVEVGQPQAALTELTEYLGRTRTRTILFLDDGEPTCWVEFIKWWEVVPR